MTHSYLLFLCPGFDACWTSLPPKAFPLILRNSFKCLFTLRRVSTITLFSRNALNFKRQYYIAQTCSRARVTSVNGLIPNLSLKFSIWNLLEYFLFNVILDEDEFKTWFLLKRNGGWWLTGLVSLNYKRRFVK